MKKIYYTTDKATVYAGNTRITVYGEAARIVNAIVLTTLVAAAIIAVAKLLK